MGFRTLNYRQLTPGNRQLFKAPYPQPPSPNLLKESGSGTVRSLRAVPKGREMVAQASLPASPGHPLKKALPLICPPGC